MSGGDIGFMIFLYIMAALAVFVTHGCETGKPGEAVSSGLLWPFYVIKRFWEMKL